MDEDTSWQKQLLVGVVLLLIVGLLVGGIVGFVALKAADVAGVGETRTPDTGPPPGLGPTTASPESTTSARPPKSTPTTPTTTKPTRTRRPPQRAIVLTAFPQQATILQRVTLSGSYQAPPGTSLQVQRDEGGTWVDFPTSATANGGTFSTYVATGQEGRNLFRVVDTSTGRTSNVVVVTIS